MGEEHVSDGVENGDNCCTWRAGIGRNANWSEKEELEEGITD